MKTILTFLLPVLIILSGIIGCILFVNGIYYISAVLSMTSVVSFACWITMMHDKKTTLG
ncbi:MAG: hypothetical protein QM731_19375 [Chitinophagaceae bacterium]